MLSKHDNSWKIKTNWFKQVSANKTITGGVKAVLILSLRCFIPKFHINIYVEGINNMVEIQDWIHLKKSK